MIAQMWQRGDQVNDWFFLARSDLEVGGQCSSRTIWLKLGEICNYDYGYHFLNFKIV